MAESRDTGDWTCGDRVLDCTSTRLVGIVNATPDSFTDQGAHFGTGRSVRHGQRLADHGADVVEVGGESLRFSDPTPEDEEIERVVPVIAELADTLSVPVAIDTFKPAVASAAIAAGATIVNDPTGLRDPQMREVVAASSVGVVAAHFVGPPKVRPTEFPAIDVPSVVLEWARENLELWAREGIDPQRVIIDPGVGLGKSPEQDLDLLHRLAELRAVGRPLLIPISNKKVIGAVTGAPAKQRLGGTAAALTWCRAQGATVFRVHNVRFLSRVRAMTDALVNGEPARWYDVPK